MLFPIKKVRASSICSSAFCNRRWDVPLPGKITDCDHCEQVGHLWAIDQEGGCSDLGPRVVDWNEYFVDLNSLDRYPSHPATEAMGDRMQKFNKLE